MTEARQAPWSSSGRGFGDPLTTRALEFLRGAARCGSRIDCSTELTVMPSGAWSRQGAFR
jgi:hypothetical protein